MAMSAFVSNISRFAPRHSETPLRVLSLMAVSASLKMRGLKLDPASRHAVLKAMELGARLNDRFDGDPYDPATLRARILSFSASPWRKAVRQYARRLRLLEKGRPAILAKSAEMQSYRESVNTTSLALLWSIASRIPLDQAEHEVRRETDLRLLFHIVMLAQVIDDILDVRKDRLRRLPSFATASDADSAAIRRIVPHYSRPVPLRLDGNFTYGVMLRLVGWTAMIAIAFRPIERAMAD